MTDMITAKEAAQKWNVTPRYVQMACKDGLISGAVQWGRAWMIPACAERPSARGRNTADPDLPMPRKTPFLDMTDLYHTPGCAEDAIAKLSFNPEAQILFAAEIDYARGQIDKVYEKASYLLGKHSGFYAILAGGMLLGFCAMWRGDIELWKKAKQHICEAPIRTDSDREIVALTLAALDSSIYDITSFPDWFRMGIFELLPADAFPAAKVFYAKYLYVAGYAVASNQLKLPGVQGTSLLTMLPNTFEPMICQAMADKTVIAEIYLRMVCAEAYHNSGDNAQAIRQIDRAIALAAPDGLWGILVEHRKALDNLLDERIAALMPHMLGHIKALAKTLSLGWANLSGTIRNRSISTKLTAREREVAKMAAFGMSNAEIAQALHISVAAVKQAIRLACTKGSVSSRSELITIL